ncbi:MAG: hypothetical protein K6U89_08335 [Chloroflexi bacterium]|nr:hypothetical protein [Chloroflexota bacterium]
MVCAGLVASCGRGRALPDDPALGLGSFPTPTATVPRPPEALGLAASPTAAAPTPILPPPRFVLPTLAVPTMLATVTPSPTPTREPTAPPALAQRSELAPPAPAQRSELTPFGVPTELPPPREATRSLPTVTPVPSFTPRPPPTPTETRVPTATREPVRTPTPAYPFAIEWTVTAPNCAATEVRGRFLDRAGRGVAGNVVRVVPLHKDGPPILSLPSAADGTYRVTLASGPLAGRWHVQALAPGGQLFSPPIVVETTAGECRDGGAQTVYLDYRQVR